MIHVAETIIVEGRYDRNTLSQIVDTVILDTSGFGIFNDREKLDLFRRIAEKRGIIVFTDSDGAGFQIRNFIKSRVVSGRVLHAYIPDIQGKERRKKKPSGDGKLGVEGMGRDVIVEALRRAGATMDGASAPPAGGTVTKADLYALGLSGGPDSARLRREALKRLNLPERMTANMLLEVANALYTKEEFLRLLEGLV